MQSGTVTAMFSAVLIEVEFITHNMCSFITPRG